MGQSKYTLGNGSGGGGGNQIVLVGNWGAEGGAIKMYFGEQRMSPDTRSCLKCPFLWPHLESEGFKNSEMTK